jgi:hypothetical protein
MKKKPASSRFHVQQAAKKSVRKAAKKVVEKKAPLAKKAPAAKKTPAAKKAVAKKARVAKKAPVARKQSVQASSVAGPVTLEEAQALAGGPAPARAPVKATMAGYLATPKSVEEERNKLRAQRDREDRERLANYKATMTIMKKRGVKGLPAAPAGEKEEATATPLGVDAGPVRRRSTGAATVGARPLQVLAEGDSWFDYPVPLFGGGIIDRLVSRLGVPILNLAKAGDEARYMLGVEERQKLIDTMRKGCPAGGSWDALLFSGGGNDIVDNPMVLWVRDFKAGVAPKDLINQARYDSALALVRSAYEDLIFLRNALTPGTHLFFHAYDFAIPDGRGICKLGPWLKPALDARGVPAYSPVAFGIVKEMLTQFAAMLKKLESSYKGITFINGQGTLAPVKTSWHNELHPSRAGFDQFADLFHAKIRAVFPGRVL